jgi:hypothetical protein
MLHRASELVEPCEHGNETSCPIKEGEFLERVAVSLSRMTLLYKVGLVSYTKFKKKKFTKLSAN